jgi:hypothetical protein
MSREHLTTIVSRALTDEAYRSQLLSDPDAALEGYDLSESEQKVVRNLSADVFDELTVNLESRQSKSGFLGFRSLMGGKDTVNMDSVVNLLMNKYSK